MAVGTIFFMANIIMGIVTDSLFFYRMSTASLIMRLERILAGLGIGLFIPSGITIFTEISHTKTRGGIFTSFIMLFYIIDLIWYAILLLINLN